MKICENEHRTIVYDDQETENKGIFLWCPLCDTYEKICNLEDQIKDLKKKKK